MVVMSEENSNTTTHHSASSLAVGEISNTAAAFSVRNWYDQHQAVHQHANHSYFPQMPSQYSNGKKLLNVFLLLIIYWFITIFFCVLFAIKK
jgi:hypothetical protein